MEGRGFISFFFFGMGEIWEVAVAGIRTEEEKEEEEEKRGETRHSLTPPPQREELLLDWAAVKKKIK